MSKTIDERVVSMQFDNKQFETNVKTSISTLDRLKKSLNLSGASKSLDDVNTAARKVDMTGLGKGVEAVKVKFSALEVMAVTALTNITNSAVNAGKRLVSSFTIEPIRTGFNEYELKMGSVQTIMASTGESLETVNKYLAELNEYSDKTIYSFSDMTSNIGKFTNAGVKLEDAVLAIKGISNEAAISGANANEASRAMYNFAQALSAGYVKLIDWKSIENANMATVQFKQQLIDAAVAAGTLTQVTDGYKTSAGTVITPTKNFNESLQDQWMTTEVLVSTLKDYADETTEIGEKATAAATEVKTFTMLMDTLKESAQSGWANTWELIIGDFEEAKEFWTEVNNRFGAIIEASADRRNQIIGDAFGSNWEKLARQIEDTGVPLEDFQNKLIEVAKSHGIAIDEMIEEQGSFAKVMTSGEISSSIIIETLESFIGATTDASVATEDLNAKLEEYQDIVDRIFRGEFGNGAERMQALADAGYDYAEVQALVNKVAEGGEIAIEDLSDAQLENLGYTEEQISALRNLAEQARRTGTPVNELINNMSRPSGRQLLIESFKNILEAISKIMDAIKKAWDEVFGEVDGGEILYNLIDGFHSFTEKLILCDETLAKITGTARLFFQTLFWTKSVTMRLVEIIANSVSKIMWAVGLDILTVTEKLGNALYNFTMWIMRNEYIVKAVQAVVDVIETLFFKIRDWLKALVESEAFQDKIMKIGNALKSIFDGLVDHFSGFGKVVKDFIDRIKQLDSISLEDVINIIKDFKDNVLGYFFDIGGAFDGVSGKFADFRARVAEEIEAAGSKFQWLKDKISEFLNTIKSKVAIGDVLGIGLAIVLVGVAIKLARALELLTGAVAGFRGIFSAITGVFTSLSKGIERVSKAIAFKQIASGVLSLAIAIGILAASVWLLTKVDQKTLWSAVGALSVLILVLAALAAAAAAMSKFATTGAPKFALTSASVLMLAASLLILAISLKMVADLQPGKALANAITLMGMIAVLALIAGLLGTHVTRFTKGATTLLAMALAVRILAGALAYIDSMSLNNAGKSLGIMLGLILMLKLVANSCQGIRIGGALAIIAIAISLRVLVGALKTLDKIDLKNPAGTLLLLVSVMASFVVLMRASAHAGQYALKAGGAILAMSAALLLIALTMKIFSKMSVGELARSLTVVSTLLLVFGAVVALSQYAGANAIRAGAMLLLMSVALVVLVGCIAVLKQMKPEGLWRAVGVIAVLEALFAGLIAVTHFAKDVKGTLIIITVALALLVASIITLSCLDQGKVTNAAIAMSAVMGVFALLVASTHFLKSGAKTWKRNLGTLIGLTLIVAALAGVIFALSKCDPGSTIEIAGSLSLLLIAMSAAMTILSNSKAMTGKKLPKILAGLAGLVGVIALLAIIIGALAKLKPGSTIEIASSLSMLLLSIAATCAVLGTVGGKASAGIGAAYAMLGIVAILAVVIGALAKLEVGSTIEIAASLSLLLLSISAACLILSFAGPSAVAAAPAAFAMAAVVAILALVLGYLAELDVAPSLDTVRGLCELLLAISVATGILTLAGLGGPAALIGIGSLGVLIIEIGALMTAIGALVDKFPKLETFLDKGLPVLEKIGYAIGAFFGNMIGGFSSGVTSGLPKMVEDLSAFAEDITPFLETVSNIDESSLTSVKTLTSAVLALTTAEFLEGLNKLNPFADATESISDKLINFGTAMVAFSDIVAGNIDEGAVNSSAAMGTALAELANNLPTDPGAIKSWFVDDAISMDEFGAQLVPFGRAMVQFSSVVAGNIDQSAVEAAASAGKVMADLANSLPTDPGVLKSWFVDDAIDMNEFGAQLVPFGRAMVRFSNVVAGNIDQTAVEAAASAGSVMADLANKMPTDPGAIKSWFVDSAIDMNTFGEQLVPFGRAMVRFSSIVAGNIDQTAVEAAASAGEVMSTLANELPEDDGWWGDVFGGTEDLASFGEKLVAFGEAIVSFSDTVAGSIDSTGITAATDAAMAVVDAANGLPEEIDLSGFTGSLDEFATAMIDFSDTISGAIDLDTVETVSSAGKSLAEMANTMPDEVDLARVTNGLTSFGEAMIDFSDTVKDGINTETVNTVISAGNDLATMASSIPQEVDLTTFATGVTNIADAIVDFSDTVTGGIDTDAITTATTAGSMITGFIATIPDYIDMTDFVNNAASAATAIKDFATNAGTDLNTAAITSAVTAGKQITGFMSTVPDYIDMTDFANNVGSAAKAIGDFASNIGENVDITTITNATNAGINICSFIEKIPDYIDMTDFVSNAGDAGTAIMDFANNTGELNSSTFNTAISAGRQLTGFIDTIPSSVDIHSFASALPSLSESMNAFASDLAGFTMPDLASIASGFQAVANSGINSTIERFNNAGGKMSAAGQTLVDKITSGISSKISTATSKMTNLAARCVAVIRSSYSSFYNAGGYCVQGFANGISANTFLATAKARAMANAAEQAARNALDMNSPSKVFRAIGMGVPEGFAQGIGMLGGTVKGAVVGMANTALDGTKNAMSRIASVLDADLDTQPTIRPVVDLSDVSAGANTINGMLSMQPSVGVRGMLSSISYSMNRRGQNGGDSEVVSAINKLRKDVGNLENRSYSVGNISYSAGDEVSGAIETLVRAIRVEGRA